MASYRDYEKLWEQYQKECVSEILASSYIAKVRELFTHTSSGIMHGFAGLANVVFDSSDLFRKIRR